MTKNQQETHFIPFVTTCDVFSINIQSLLLPYLSVYTSHVVTKGIKCISCWFFVIQYYLSYPLTHFQSNSILPILFLIFFNRHVPVTRPSHDVTRVTKGIKCISCRFFVIQWYLPYPLTHPQNYNTLHILFHTFFDRHVPLTHCVTRRCIKKAHFYLFDFFMIRCCQDRARSIMCIIQSEV